MSSLSRRSLLASSAGLLGSAPLMARTRPARPLAPGVPGRDYRPVVTPDGATLPFRVVDGVKVFHLVAEPVTHTFAPGIEAEAWGYNGRVHGPTIEAVEGDRVRIHVTNRLPVPTSVHWHGLVVPNGMDGVGGLTQRVIEPGETFRHEFTLQRAGTFLYHSHHDEMVQMALGLMGLFVVHPRAPEEPLPERDYAFLLSEWKLVPGTRRPDPAAMDDFNLLTLNGRVYPATSPLVARTGERVRIRFGNLSAVDHHPMHLHGARFEVTGTDGGTIPPHARWPETTVLVPVGTTRTIEFVPEEPGDWPLHCHMTHHLMNRMGHGLPNWVGTTTADLEARLASLAPGAGPLVHAGGHGAHAAHGPFGPIAMGGMFTLLQVRDQLEGQRARPYEHPPGSVAAPATPTELARDGIDGNESTTPAPPTDEHHEHAHHH